MSEPNLPQDLAAAHAIIERLTQALAEKEQALNLRDKALAERDEALANRDVELARLDAIIKKLQRRQFGQSSEKLDPEQFALGLEDLETGIASAEADAESKDKSGSTRSRTGTKRAKLPDHLPRIEVTVDIDDKSCPCCGGELHVIGEEKSERLDVIKSQHRVLVTRRPKYACRSCTDGVVQAPAPARLIEGGLPTEAMVAHVLVGKFADHLPLYRQHQILARQGIDIDRSCLADWVGRAAFALRPVTARMLELLKQSTKLFCDETSVPVLNPGAGKTKRGYLWAIARDDRPWRGPEPPGVVYVYAPGRAGKYALDALKGFQGVLQVDGYGGYNALADERRPEQPLDIAFCWAHWRRDFFDIAKTGNAPIATEAILRIKALYKIEDDIRGLNAEERHDARQTQSKPLVDDLYDWLAKKLPLLPKSATIAEVIRYGIKRRAGFSRFLDDGQIEIDNNTVERSIRPITLNRKNALFAGSDEGGAAWALIASLIETCKLNNVEPQGYLTDVLTKIVEGWPMSQIDKLLPWAYVA
jgi:transposase